MDIALAGKSATGRENGQHNALVSLRGEREGKATEEPEHLEPERFRLGQRHSESLLWGHLPSTHSLKQLSILSQGCRSSTHLLAGWAHYLCFLQSQTCHRREGPSGPHSGNSSCCYIPLGQKWRKTSRGVRTHKARELCQIPSATHVELDPQKRRTAQPACAQELLLRATPLSWSPQESYGAALLGG